MQFPYELQLGWRYTRAGRTSGRNGFISFISIVSMLGIALGVATLIIVLSVMNGFQKDVRNNMLSVIPAVKVVSRGDGIPNWEEVKKLVETVPRVASAAPYIDQQVLLANGDEMLGVLVTGIVPELEAKITEVAQGLYATGELQQLTAGGFNIVIGQGLAWSLGVGIGDQVTVVAPTGQMTPAGVMPRLKQMTVVGIFASDHYQYDSSLVLIHIEDAQRMFRTYGPTGIRIKVDDMQYAREVNAAIADKLLLPENANLLSQAGRIGVTDWTRENKTWFDAVQVERTMLFIILTLIVAVAAFNLVSTLVMTVTDKHADIAILRTLGAKPSSIMTIFMVQGAVVGFMGTGLGVALGVIVSTYLSSIVKGIEGVFGVEFLPKDIYFLSRMPSDLHLKDISTITLIALGLAFVATIYPSWRASRVNPAEALRYE